MKSNSIQVDTGAEECALLTRGGQPVWPAGSRRLLDALDELIAVYGGRLVPVAGEPSRPLTGPGIVVALGEDVRDAAALYAHLTFRELRILSAGERIDRREFPEVVVTLLDRLRPDLFDELYGDIPCGRLAPGLLCAHACEDLLPQVLVRSAASVLAVPPATRRIDLCPGWLEPVRVESRPEGHDVSPQSLASLLSREAGLLTVETHSDGLDAFLGWSEKAGFPVVLCPLGKENEDSVAPAPVPRCLQTGKCYRLSHLDLPHAFASGRLVNAGVAAAQILLLRTCWGMVPSGYPVASYWSLGRKLYAENPRVGAAITTWSIASFSPHSSGLADRISSGVPVGEALAQELADPDARRMGPGLCLFGDPRTSLPAPEIPREPTAMPVAPTRNLDPHDMGFLRVILTEQAAESRNSQVSTDPKYAQEAVTALQFYEHASWVGERLEDRDDAAGPVMRHVVLRFMLQQATHHWFVELARRMLAGVQVMRADRCDVCSSSLHTVVQEYRVAGTSPRRVSTCPVCGLIEHQPVHSDLAIRVEPGRRVHLEGTLPTKAWHAGLMLRSPRPEPGELYAWFWPRDSSGAPAPWFRPDSWPVGQAIATLFLLHHGQIFLLSRNYGDAGRNDG